MKNFKKNKKQKSFNDIEEGKSLKEIADSVMSLSGNAKGETIANNLNYIIEKKGNDGLAQIENMMSSLGYPIKYSDIDRQKWYKESLNVLINLTAKDVFGWGDEEIFESGRGAPRSSFFTKVMVQYLVSAKVLMKNANRYWRKNCDFADIVPIDVTERSAIFRVEGYNKSTVSCIYQAGYYFEIFTYVVGKEKNIIIEETMCNHAGDACHEYKVIWN